MLLMRVLHLRISPMTSPHSVFSKTSELNLGSIAKLGFIVLIMGLGVWFLNAGPAHAANSAGNRADQQIILQAAPEKVFESAPEAFKQWSRGEFVSSDTSSLTVTGLSKTNFFKFVDDITVSVQPVPDQDNQTQLTVTSVGRMGEYDFGGNQRNIDEYVAALKSVLSLS